MADALLTSSSSSHSDNYGYETAEEEADNMPRATVYDMPVLLSLGVTIRHLFNTILNSLKW